jgi:hypothetical protein
MHTLPRCSTQHCTNWRRRLTAHSHLAVGAIICSSSASLASILLTPCSPPLSPRPPCSNTQAGGCSGDKFTGGGGGVAGGVLSKPLPQRLHLSQEHGPSVSFMQGMNIIVFILALCVVPCFVMRCVNFALRMASESEHHVLLRADKCDATTATCFDVCPHVSCTALCLASLVMCHDGCTAQNDMLPVVPCSMHACCKAVPLLCTKVLFFTSYGGATKSASHCYCVLGTL